MEAGARGGRHRSALEAVDRTGDGESGVSLSGTETQPVGGDATGTGSGAGPPQNLARVVETCLRLSTTTLGARATILYRLEHDRPVVVSRLEVDGTAIPAAHAAANLARRVALSGLPALHPQPNAPRSRSTPEPASLLAVPVMLGDQHGVLIVADQSSRRFTAVDQGLLTDCALVLAATLAGRASQPAPADATQAVQRLAGEHAAWREVAELVAGGADADQVFADVARRVTQLLGVDVGTVVEFPDADTMLIRGSYGPAHLGLTSIGARLPIDDRTAVRLVLETKRPVRMRYDPSSSDHAPRLPVLRERVAVPLHANGRVWGSLAVATSREEPIDALAEQRLMEFADLAGLAITSAEASRLLQRSAVQSAAAARLGQRALEAVDLSELLAGCVFLVADTLGIDYACWVELDADTDELTVRASHGAGVDRSGLRLPLAGSVTGRAVADAGPVIIDDTRTADLNPSAIPDGTASAAAVLVAPDGVASGALVLHAARPGAFSSDDLSFLQACANIVGAAVERLNVEDQIRHQALHDALTGLPNRALLIDRLGRALHRAKTKRRRVAVLFCDLDDFKSINDAAGHGVGDQLLVDVAARLGRVIGADDTLSRVGGDEFVIVSEDSDSGAAASDLAARIHLALADPVAVGGGERQIGVSIGIVVRAGSDPQSMLRDADTAMYRAKTRGRARSEVFDAAMRRRLLDRVGTEVDLRRAVERDELTLEYQPIVNSHDGVVQGFEALIRWHHPDRGLLPPADFIPTAEETGLIGIIGRWVLSTAAAAAAGWNDEHRQRPPVAINVNLSPHQLGDPNLVDHVAGLLATHKLWPGQLGVEITESALLDHDASHTDRLRQLRRLGCRLVLDDFGTGYSSLGYLQRFPLDCLKLDRSFIAGLDRDPTATNIVAAITRLARALDLAVVAEGVERRTQLVSVQALDCDAAQGFYFSRPVAYADTQRLLAAAPGWPRQINAAGDG